MKVKEIKKILEQYSADTDIFVLEKLRGNGFRNLLNLLNVKETTDKIQIKFHFISKQKKKWNLRNLRERKNIYAKQRRNNCS